MPRGQQSTVPNSPPPMLGTFFSLTGKSVYDVTKFYTAGTDSKGHYERARVKMTPSLQAMAEQIVSQVPEYNTVEDMLRDALLHRVMYFQTQGIPIDEQRMAMELHIAEMAKMRAIVESQQSYIEDCHLTVDAAIEVGDWSMLADIISEMEERFDTGGFPQVTQAKLGEAVEDAWRRMATGRSSRTDRRSAVSAPGAGQRS